MNERNKDESLWLSLDEEIEAGLQEGEKWEKAKKAAKAVGKATGRGLRNLAYGVAGGTIGALTGGVPGMLIGASAGLGAGAAENAIKYSKDAKKERVTESYTDFELLEILESCGYEANFSNLEMLKEGLQNGTITLADEPQEAEVAEAEEDLKQSDIKTVDVPEVKAEVPTEPKKSVREIKGIRSHSDSFLKSYLTEDCGVALSEVTSLTEEQKTDTLRELAKSVASVIRSKLADIDTSIADKSRGDIKELKVLGDIQNAITQLEAIVERADEYSPECKKYIGVVIKSILYLNQYSNVFKDAYRNKKTLLILEYETIILSIISSLSYLISQIVDFRSQSLGMKPVVEIEEIAPLKTLIQFNKSVDSGEFKIITNDVNVLREYYKELPVESLSIVCESSGIINLVIDGLNSLYNGLDKNKITQLLYKATGVVVLLLSVRDAVYSLSRMKTKSSDMLSMISNFANINLGGGMKSLASFASRFTADAESSSEIASNEISSDDRRMSVQLKAIKAAPVIDNVVPEDPQANTGSVGNQEAIPSANDMFSFNF